MKSLSNRIFSIAIAISFFSIPAYMNTDMSPDTEETFLQDEATDFAPIAEKDDAIVKASNVLIADEESEKVARNESDDDDDQNGGASEDDAQNDGLEQEAEPASFDDSDHVFNLEDDEADEF